MDDWLPGYYFKIGYGATAVTLTAVPEPGALVLLAIALAAGACYGLSTAGRRMRQDQAG